MPYMLLIHEPVGQRLTRSQAEGEAVYGRMLKFAEELKSEGVLLGVASLGSQDNAARVRVSAGKPQVLDGPFAEAKGFYLVRACRFRIGCFVVSTGGQGFWPPHTRSTAMRFMIIFKSTPEFEAETTPQMPDEKLMAAMADFHEELAQAGVLLDASGLQPSRKGWRIHYDGQKAAGGGLPAVQRGLHRHRR